MFKIKKALVSTNTKIYRTFFISIRKADCEGMEAMEVGCHPPHLGHLCLVKCLGANRQISGMNSYGSRLPFPSQAVMSCQVFGSE